MTTRKIYEFLLRLHPSCFRKQYENQMLWIFDESVQSRGAVSLLFDAAVSLVRQWVLRSAYWRHARPALADGTYALAEMLHRNSQKQFRRARWLNLCWLAGSMIVIIICPIPSHFKIYFAGPFASAYFLITGRKTLQRRTMGFEYISLFYYKSSREFYRTEIQARRDGLRAWAGNWRMGSGISVMIFILSMTVVWMIRLAIMNYRGVPNFGPDWDHSRYFVYGIIALALSWRFIGAVNGRAVQAIQQEIDAMDQSS